LGAKPLFQILPGLDLIVKRSGAISDGGKMVLQYQALLVLEIVVELPLPGSGSFDDLIWARRSKSLFVKQLGSSPDDPKSRLGSPLAGL
jgi:hypothetical protein